MSENLFEVQQTPATQQEPAPAELSHQADIFAHQLLDIKNEKGEPKYRSVEEGLKALKHSQEYIAQLTQKDTQYQEEIAALRAELTKRQSVEDAIASFSKPIAPEVTQPTGSVAQGLDEASVRKLLTQTLTEREAYQAAQSNTETVRKALVAKYGDKASAEVSAKAQSLGMTMEAISELASRSPQAVLALFNASSPATSGAPMRSTVNIPLDNPEPPKLQKPEGSMLRGAKQKDQVSFLNKIREEVLRKHGIN